MLMPSIQNNSDSETELHRVCSIKTNGGARSVFKLWAVCNYSATMWGDVVLLKVIDDVPACHHSMVIGLSRRRFVVVHLAPVAMQYPEPSAVLVVDEMIP